MSKTLEKAIRACTLCPLHATCKQPIPLTPWENSQPGGVVFMVSAPSYADDRRGVYMAPPNRGRQSMSTAFRSILSELYQDDLNQEIDEPWVLGVMGSVRCKPEHQFADHPEAIHACKQWTEEELAHYDPAMVILVGGDVLKDTFGAEARIGQFHGKVRAYRGRLWGATYSFGAVIHKPELRQVIVDDLRAYRSLYRRYVEELSF